MKRVVRGIGSAVAEPGRTVYGEWRGWPYADGAVESLPLIIAQGRSPGPCLWLTAGIHGDEQSGPAVLYQLVSEDLVRDLKGTVVAMPALSPLGLRSHRHIPNHVRKNPNRVWPDPRPGTTQDEDDPDRTSMEAAYLRVFRGIVETADLLIDFHNAWPRSLSFALRDRILFDHRQIDAALRAETLARRQDEMLQAYGHTIVGEFPPRRYLEEGLHRSLSASVLLGAGIPAFTAELGPGGPPSDSVVAAAVAGTRNVMRWAGMLNGPSEP